MQKTMPVRLVNSRSYFVLKVVGVNFAYAQKLIEHASKLSKPKVTEPKRGMSAGVPSMDF